MPESRINRDVVSYVRRGDRMNPSQQRAWDTLRGQYLLDIPTGERHTSIATDASIDWDAAFRRQAPLMVEIGSGTGDVLVAAGLAHPQANIVGFEVFLPVVASTMSALKRAGVENVRLICADGQQGVATLFKPESITELWTFFPDPWHKKKHHKRRLVSPAFAALVAQRLLPGGYWHLATDWDDYAAWMLETLEATPGLANAAPPGTYPWSPRFDLRPVTRFEQRAINAGRTVRDLCYQAVSA